MDRPNIAKVKIQWVDKDGDEHDVEFSESTLEEAHDLIGLMIGEITEEDLKDDLDEEQMDEFCPSCGEEYDEVDYEYQICHLCDYNNVVK